MKLKLFEEFSDRLFREILTRDFNFTLEDFSQREVNILQNFKFDFGPVTINGPLSLSLDNFPDCKGLNALHIKNKRGYYMYIFIIYKSTDEWYYIQDRRGSRIYKCDTFDGVLQCLNYLKK